MLNFQPPSPFGRPKIGPIQNNTSQSPAITAIVTHRTSFPYTCGPATATAEDALAGSGDGIIIVDPPGGNPKGKKKKTQKKTPAKGKTRSNKSAKPVGKSKDKSKSKRAGQTGKKR